MVAAYVYVYRLRRWRENIWHSAERNVALQTGVEGFSVVSKVDNKDGRKGNLLQISQEVGKVVSSP